MTDKNKPDPDDLEARTVEHFDSDLIKGESGKPWHQLKEETPDNYSRFCMYLKLGPFKRSFRRMKEKGQTISTISTLSARYQWVARAHAWDLHLIEIEQRQAEHESKVLGGRLVRDRHRVQEQFRKAIIHETKGAVKHLHKVALTGGDTAKIKAWEVILKGGGYEAPIGINIDAIDDDIIKAILERELASLVEALPEAKAALFSELLTEAFDGLSDS